MKPASDTLVPPRSSVRSCVRPASTRPLLIVAYGNPLRGDDGLAWRAADELEARVSSETVEILRLHQLTPELAEAVSHAAIVVFVDAACSDGEGGRPGEIRVREIRLEQASAGEQTRFFHHLTPGAIVALAATLYGATARAYSVTLAGHDFDHGWSLSPAVEAALPALVQRIEAVIGSFHSPMAFPADSGKA